MYIYIIKILIIKVITSKSKACKAAYIELKNHFYKWRDNMQKYSLLKDTLDLRDIVYSFRHKVEEEELPRAVDLRYQCSPIVDQGALGSCTSNALASGLREHLLLNYERAPFSRLSRIYLYWWSRKLDNNENQDSGATLRDSFKALQKMGVCRESTRPYIIEDYKTPPTEYENREASYYTIPGYQRLNSIKEIKHAVAHNHVVVFGITVYKSFEDSVKSDGRVPYPGFFEQKLGGHAMCIVGYDDNLYGGSFIVRNSWGTNWGDKGYCYIPYGMYRYFIDVWTVKLGVLYDGDEEYISSIKNNQMSQWVKNILRF